MSKFKLVSFDIFDTLFIRSCGDPQYIFYLLALETMGENTPINKILDFIQMRKEGETKAMNSLKVPDEDVTLKDIYTHCNFKLFTSKSTTEILEKELDIEEKNLLAVHSMKEKVQKARSKADRIAFISDMYVPESFLRKLLSDNGFYKEQDIILVSSEWKKKKATGHLFDCLEAIIGHKLSSISWHHYGDNIKSDGIQVLKKGGIPHLIKYKQTFYNQWLNKKETNVYEAPISRLAAMLHTLYYSQPYSIQTKLIIDLIAPLFIPFVYFILSDAIKKRKKTLFFFARDSYILYVIAQQIIKELNWDINIKYIYISRKVIYPLLLVDTPLDEIIELHKKNDKLIYSVQRILENYIPKDLIPQQILNKKCYTDQDITEKEKIELIKNILSNTKVKDYCKNKKNELFNYLLQEGFIPTTEDVAFVDLAGSRSSQHILNKCLTQNGYHKVFGYYLINMGNISIIKDHNYLSQIQIEWPNIKIFLPIIEDFYTITNQGRTIGYQEEKHKYIPIFTPTHNANSKEKLMKQLHMILSNAVSLYIKNKLYLHNPTLQTISTLLTIEFSRNPQKEYLKAFDNFIVRENESQENFIIDRLTFKDFLLCLRKKTPKSAIWGVGSIIRHHILGKQIITLYNARSLLKYKLTLIYYYILRFILLRFM